MGVSLLCLLSRKARIRRSKTLYVALTSVFRSLHEPFPTCNASGAWVNDTHVITSVAARRGDVWQLDPYGDGSRR
jgi:hypothetical protein